MARTRAVDLALRYWKTFLRVEESNLSSNPNPYHRTLLLAGVESKFSANVADLANF
jgi:hypothetical protein